MLPSIGKEQPLLPLPALLRCPFSLPFFSRYAGNIRLDEPLSGDSGQEYTAVETVTEMRRVGFTAIARLPAQSP